MANLSEVRLLRNIPLKINYADTFAFSSLSAQISYFASRAAFTYTNLSYVKNQPISLPDILQDIDDCNYLMYRNEDDPSKWHFAFITNMQYIANGTTLVFFEEDYIQTWLYQMQFNPCFIERQHVNSDEIGENLIEENFALGNYIVNRYKTLWFTDWWIVTHLK